MSYPGLHVCLFFVFYLFIYFFFLQVLAQEEQERVNYSGQQVVISSQSSWNDPLK